jgi:ABC-type polar amino acid transport system ATPase subunit
MNNESASELDSVMYALRESDFVEVADVSAIGKSAFLHKINKLDFSIVYDSGRIVSIEKQTKK